MRSLPVAIIVGVGFGLASTAAAQGQPTPAVPVPTGPVPTGAPTPNGSPTPSDAPATHAERPVPTVVPSPARLPTVQIVVEPHAPEKRSAPPSVALVYDRGLVFAAADGSFSLRLSFRNQVRFETVRPTEDKSQFQSRFSIPRSRVQLEGNVFDPATRYKLELSFGELGSYAFIKDLFVEQQLAPSTWLRAGQWKRPFNRQELVSDFSSLMNERAITAAFAGGGRDLGIAVHNDYEKSPEGLEWVLGVFNGFSGGADRPAITTTCAQNAMTGVVTCVNPAPTTVPIDFGPAIVARAGINVGKIKGYSEGDVEGGPFRLAIGASYKIDLANLSRRAEASVADNLSHGVQGDLMLKAHGFALELGAYLMKIKSADPQLGYFAEPSQVIAQRVMLGGRFAYAPVGARKQIEARIAVTVLWHGHAWKWANDAGVLQLTRRDPMTGVVDKPDVQVRSMLQLTF